nr:hypothetical protein [Tanacetum cinerariifolium]
MVHQGELEQVHYTTYHLMFEMLLLDHHPNQTSCFFESRWGFLILNNLNLAGVYMDSITINDMPKELSSYEREAPAERISNDLEEIARVLTSMDAATILAGEANVPTSSGFIPTAGPPATIVSTGSEVGPTASPIVQRRKGKEILVESDTLKKKKLQE